MSGRLDSVPAALLVSVCESLDVRASATQQEQLLAYIVLLRRWNSTYNLTAVRSPSDMVSQHLADCLAVVGPLRRHLAGRRPVRLLDVGSGAGLPGCVIAVLEPEIDVVCVDSVGKKTAFVQHVAGELVLKNLTARHARVERLDAPPFDVIASRAFASLPDFVALTRRLLAPEGAWMAMKGKRPDGEIDDLKSDHDVFHVEQLQVPSIDGERCLVWIRARQEAR